MTNGNRLIRVAPGETDRIELGGRMGRTLETLRQSEGARRAIVGRSDSTVEECVVEWTLGEEEAPYIEVGGPEKKIELSPSLVHKHPPQPRVQPPHAVAEKAAATPVADLTAAQPMMVSYEAWPGAAVAPGGVAPEVIAYHDPEHVVSRQYAELLGKMLHDLPSESARVLLLAGMRPRVGTTAVLLNLAVTAARTKKRRVALLDAHWSSPGLASRLGHEPSAGIADALGGRLALEQAVLRTALPNLDLLPAGITGKPNTTPSVMAAAWLIAWLRGRYDLILIDGPAFGAADDVATLAPQADGAYLVLPQGEASAEARDRAQTFIRHGARLRGFIHTHFAM